MRANYENQRLNVEKARLPLKEFFKVLLFGYDVELKNRFLKIGQEYGTKAAKAISGLHRHVAIKRKDVVIKRLIAEKPRISATGIATKVNRSTRQVQRILAELKKTGGLKRRGARKNGEWFFE